MKENEMIWSALLHLGTNMWRDKYAPGEPDDIHNFPDSGVFWCDELRFDLDVFHKITEKMPEMGLNTIIIDVGDGVRYDSHPEIGVIGALTPDELRDEVRRLRALGLEPVPKLNFSAGHDAWLGQYEIMLATDIYRRVVGDLIHEICEIFEKPKYIHLGMDEELPHNQSAYGFMAVRAAPLWLEDFNCMLAACEKENARPWIWADYFYEHKELFATKIPKTVILSNPFYRLLSGPNGESGELAYRYRAFFEMAELGFDQIPATTTWNNTLNTRQVMRALTDKELPNIIGWMSAPWMNTTEVNYYDILGDIARVGYAKKEFGDRFR